MSSFNENTETQDQFTHTYMYVLYTHTLDCLISPATR